MKNPKQGEIWTIVTENIDILDTTTEGVLVLSIPALKSLPFRIAVPLTQTTDHHIDFAWLVSINSIKINPNSLGLTADAKRCLSFPMNRFIKRLGITTPEELQLVREAVAMCLGIVPA
jgi:hypothetical protein